MADMADAADINRLGDAAIRRDITYLFAYGTLLPGDERWPMLASFVVDEGWPDRVPGQLFDTGLGYPAARFDTRSPAPSRSSAMILGRTFALLQTSLDQALAVLDEEEETVEGYYHRIVVTTEGGHLAWAYAAGFGLDLTPIPSGDWLAHRRIEP